MRNCDLTCKFEAEDETKRDGTEIATFSGVASTSGTDLHNDIICAGAFEPIPMKTNGEPDVLLLRDHDHKQIIGGWTSFIQNDQELWVEGELLLAVEKARETYALMRRGFLSGLSVGFNISDEKDAVQIDQRARKRYIKKATLKECSIVAAPANRDARVISVKDELADLFRLGDMTRDEIEVLFKEGLESLIGVRRDAQKPYGDVPYADPGFQEDKKKRYPIDTEAHIRNAWSRISQNERFYSRDQLDKIKARIIAAWKRVIDKDGPPAAQEDSEGPPDMQMIQEALNRLQHNMKARYHG